MTYVSIFDGMASEGSNKTCEELPLVYFWVRTRVALDLKGLRAGISVINSFYGSP